MEIKVPTFPESITEGTLISWLKQPGDAIAIDEVIAEVETDKVVFEVPSPVNGKFISQLVELDGTVTSELAIAVIEEGAVVETAPVETATIAASSEPSTIQPASQPANLGGGSETAKTSPAVRKQLAEKNLTRQDVAGSGKDGRILKSDVANYQPQATQSTANDFPSIIASSEIPVELEERVAMSRIRKRIASRLLESTQETAMLTTFNEVNMQPIMYARKQYKELFEKENGVKLGFMSFFIRAVCQALLRHPDVNASIDGDDIIYHGYCDIGIAVSTERGLVVPILRRSENLTFAEIEQGINDFAVRGRQNKLTIDDLTGGTFSITNGGVFGSLMSTPIINPPQSAILGMHAIKQRPIAENGQVVIRPMMYLALSYDHRIIDGKTSVTFLRNLKEMLEDPMRLVMNI